MIKKIFFNNSKGNKLCGILSNPASNNSTPIIILCHGLISSKDGSTNTQLETMLNKHTISTFRFDFMGRGESEGRFEETTISEAVDSILKAIEVLKNLGYSRIGLVGNSFGGSASIMAASKTKDLFLLVLRSPIPNYKERDTLQKSSKQLHDWKEKGIISYGNSEYKIKYTFFEDFDHNNGYKVAKQVSIPTLIVHGDKDESAPIEQSKKISKLFPNCKLKIIRDADHRYSKPEQFQKVLDLISSFIIEKSQL